MASEDLLHKLIETLSPSDFNKVAVAYLNIVEGITNVIDVNSPYDSGIDMEDRTDPDALQFQITTCDKGVFEAKLWEDLGKAKQNVEKYAKPNEVKYFYSKGLTNRRILEFQKEARSRQMKLDLVEANRLSELGKLYPELGSLIIQLSGIDQFKRVDQYFDDVKVQGFYDLITHGSPSDLKYNILESFCIHHLFLLDGQSADDLHELVCVNYTEGIDQAYFEMFLHKLSSNQKIRISKEDNTIRLTDKERQRISTAIEAYRNEEALLKRELQFVLSDYGLEEVLNDLISQLLLLFESNYSINVSEFMGHNGNINDFVVASKRFESWLKRKLTDDRKTLSPLLSKRILDVCDGHTLLKNISAGQVLAKFGDTDRLQEYFMRNATSTDIFLDTNVLVHLACASYNNRSAYDNYNYSVACQLQQFALDNGLRFRTSRQYAVELEQQIVQALRLVPFASLPLFHQLGGTRNSFYRFFEYLKGQGQLESGVESFTDFMAEFGYRLKSGAIGMYRQETEFLLTSMMVQVESNEKFYATGDTIRLLEADSGNRQYRKTAFAIANDAIMFERLGDSDTSINPRDPFFCTWDLTLVKARENYFKKNINCTRWYIYTPARLMDYFSMMKLRIRPGAVSREVMAIVSNNVDLQGETKTLLDTMIAVINPNNEVGIRYATRLAELRDSNVYRVKLKLEAPTESFVEVPAVDIMFNEMFSNYVKSDDPSGFSSFKELFSNESLMDDVLTVFVDEVDKIAKAGKVSSAFFASIESLLKRQTEPQ